MKPTPRLRLLAVAGTCRGILEGLGFANAGELIRFVQDAVGPTCRVTGDARLIEAPEDDDHGGRSDDLSRAADLQRCLGDDGTAAVVALRGGAWLTRILHRVDFDVLKRRRTGVALFGFSELTPVINIAALYRRAYCYYDMGPGFLRSGMRDFAMRNAAKLMGRPDPSPETADAFATGWALGQFKTKFAEFFQDVLAVLQGRGSARSIAGTLVSGRLPARTSATFVGGNLSCFVPLLGTPYALAADCRDRWLVIEDVNELPEHADRKLAHLTLAGAWQRCRGVLVGDFHDKQKNHTDAVLALLEHHLPRQRAIPVVVTQDVGHIWPLAPLPIGRQVELTRTSPKSGRPGVRLQPPWTDWKVR